MLLVATRLLVLITGTAGAPGIEAVPGWVAALETAPAPAAAIAGASGRISGRAYEESRKAHLPHRPLQGVVVTLLPRSEGLLRRLEDIRRGARDSHDAFRAAMPRILETQEAHEQAVRAAGGTVLARPVDADGSFAVQAVPVGAWILIARDETVVPQAVQPTSKNERSLFRARPTLTAYRAVRLWLRELSVRADEEETVTLNDRNVWFSGVVEVLSPPPK